MSRIPDSVMTHSHCPTPSYPNRDREGAALTRAGEISNALPHFVDSMMSDAGFAVIRIFGIVINR